MCLIATSHALAVPERHVAATALVHSVETVVRALAQEDERGRSLNDVAL